MNPITIRTATISDAPEILDIYGYYVANTAISMEYDVPSLAEFEKRVENTLENYPYLVAEQNGKILGYAYAGRFHERAAFYHDMDVMPTHIIISCAASQFGDYFTGCSSSKLWLDAFELIY